MDEDLDKVFGWVRRRQTDKARKFLSRRYKMTYAEAEAFCLQLEFAQPWKWMEI